MLQDDPPLATEHNATAPAGVLDPQVAAASASVFVASLGLRIGLPIISLRDCDDSDTQMPTMKLICRLSSLVSTLESRDQSLLSLNLPVSLAAINTYL